MGLFSKRRNEGFDPALWTDADERAKKRGGGSWFDDLGVEGPDDVDELQTNTGARFADDDAEWLGDDPGERARDTGS